MQSIALLAEPDPHEGLEGSGPKRLQPLDHLPGGFLLEIAERHGIETPRLRRLISLVHDAETGKFALGLPTLAALTA